MLLEALFGFLFGIIGFLIGLIPDFSFLNIGFSSDLSFFIELLSYGFVIFPVELFLSLIACVVFWSSVQITWAGIEWIYKKIPGVD